MTDFIIKTLGCKVNQCESSSLSKELLSKGYENAKGDKAAICVINTCTVTANSDKKSIRLIKKMVKENRESFVLVMGCTVDSDKKSIMDISGVDVALGNKEKHKAVNIISEAVPLVNDYFSDHQILTGRTRKFIKIQDGCESFCTYCIIPYVRGKEISRPFAEILEEAKAAAKEGYKELVLTGIHLGRFNKGVEPSLPKLIEAIADIEGISRIRLSSIEINEVTDELLKLMQSNNKIAKSLHIPLQHGSSRILKLMERPYSAKDFLERIKEIKNTLSDDIGFSTDIIVGFPGETDKDVSDMIEVLREVGFHRVHTFPFSAREGTKAFDFKDKVDGNVVKKRLSLIKEATDDIQKQHYAKLEGKTRTVLLEVLDAQGYYTGYTSFYERVKVRNEANCLEKNTFIDVYIEKAYDDFCVATPINL